MRSAGSQSPRKADAKTWTNNMQQTIARLPTASQIHGSMRTTTQRIAIVSNATAC